jgi:hypothetical protein
MVSFMPQLLYPQGKSPWYPLDRRLGGPQSQSGHGGEEKNSQLLPGLETLIIQSVVQCYTTELSQLLPYICKGDKYPGISATNAFNTCTYTASIKIIMSK